MKILKSVSIIVFITLFAIGCGSSGGGGDDTQPPSTKTTTVSGTVLDDNGNPIEGAAVTIMSDPVTVTTDANGFFSATVEIGTHTLEIKMGSILIHSEQIICEENTPLQLSNITTNYDPDNNDIDNDGDSYTENQGDCNDSDININPGAEEICGDSIDQDCNRSDLTCPI
jgi:PBP1b-binding outer membrane lipoprotein LpoB